MRLRLGAVILALLVIAGVILAAVLYGPSLLFSHPQTPTTATSSNAIVLENAHLGTTDWQIPSVKIATTQIQAYTNTTSVLPEQRMSFYVSTQKAYTPYSIDIYRLGWYGGKGGRLMTSQANQISRAQGYYDLSSHRLIGCISCHIDAKTGLVEANWQPSYILTIPSNWITGIYLAKFTDVNGMQTYVPFDVRGNFDSRYVAVTPDVTYAAYNDWGGYSLYRAYDKTYGLVEGVKVSFDRPYTQGEGASQVLIYEADVIHWMEHQGYDLSYISSVDLHEDPAQLLHHSAYLSLGHDEYWTKEMRDGVEYARNHDIGLAFLGANAAYWQVRLEPDSLGTPNRTIICYKVLTNSKNLADDPFYGKDNTRVTTLWRDPALARPENALIGIMYAGNTQSRQGFPWQVNSLASSSLLEGTDLQPGKQYGCDLVGNEWDRIFENGATPKGLQVIGRSSTVNNKGTHDFGNTTYYITPSGAMVFATGSIYWTSVLDNYRFQRDNLCVNQNPVVSGIQKLMAHVMDALAVRHSLK